MKSSRTIKLPKAALQFKMILIFLCLSLSCVLLQFSMVTRAFSEISMSIPGGGPALTASLTAVMWKQLVITLLLLVPLTISVGILVTFRIAGPVYRFERHLEGLARGEDPGVCRIRKGDELQGLCDAINMAVATIRSERSKASSIPNPQPVSSLEA